MDHASAHASFVERKELCSGDKPYLFTEKDHSIQILNLLKLFIKYAQRTATRINQIFKINK